MPKNMKMRTGTLMGFAITVVIVSSVVAQEAPKPDDWDKAANSAARLGVLTDWFSALPPKPEITRLIRPDGTEEKTPKELDVNWDAIAMKLVEVPKTETFNHVDMAREILDRLEGQKEATTRFCVAALQRKDTVLQNIYPQIIALMAKKSIQGPETDKLLTEAVLRSKEPGRCLEEFARRLPDSPAFRSLMEDFGKRDDPESRKTVKRVQLILRSNEAIKSEKQGK